MNLIKFFTLLNLINLQSYLISEVRPWGSYEIIKDEKNFKLKKITVLPHKRISLQRHRYRAENWVIVQGRGVATINDRVFPVEYGSAVNVKNQDIHRIENTGDVNLEFIEVQTGTYFGEDDIERLSDDYGRK